MSNSIDRLARQINEMAKQQRTQARASQAAHRSVTVTDGSVEYTDADGNVVGETGLDPDTGVVVYTPTDDIMPPVPTAPDILPVVDGVGIVWDGTFEDGNWSAGIARVEIHRVLDDEFPPAEFNDETQVGVFTSPNGGTKYLASEPGILYQFVLQAVSQSGTEGQVSNPGEGAAIESPLVADLAELAAGLTDLEGKFPITETDITPGAITTPLMIANTILGDRIATNTLHANRIITNTITTAQLNATAIDGMTITGALIRTAAAGERVIIRNDGGGGVIESWAGLTGEVTPTIIDPIIRSPFGAGNGDIPGLRLRTGTIEGTANPYTAISRIEMYSGKAGAVGVAESARINVYSTTLNGTFNDIYFYASDSGYIGAPTLMGDTITANGSDRIIIGNGSTPVRIPSMVKQGVDSVNITTNGTPVSKTITYATPFPSNAEIPSVQATVRSSSPQLFQVGITNESRTGFTVTMNRTSGAATATFAWVATTQPS